MIGGCLAAGINHLDAIDRLLGRLGVGPAMGIEDDRHLLAGHGRVIGEDRDEQVTSVLELDVLDRRELRPGKDDVVAVDDQPFHELSLRPGRLHLLAW